MGPFVRVHASTLAVEARALFVPLFPYAPVLASQVIVSAGID